MDMMRFQKHAEGWVKVVKKTRHRKSCEEGKRLGSPEGRHSSPIRKQQQHESFGGKEGKGTISFFGSPG